MRRSPVDATRYWVENVVLGHGLCPFAASVVNAGTITYTVSSAIDDDAIYRDFLSALEGFVLAPANEVSTSLLIFSHGLTAFSDYLSFVALTETLIDEAGLSGIVQIASFHPAYLFDNSEEDDPANYTNRSPYPMLHLLREAELENAINTYPDIDQVPVNNIRRFRKLGLDYVRARLLECLNDSDRIDGDGYNAAES